MASTGSGRDPNAQNPVHGSSIGPQIQNIVATCNLGCRIELKTLALHIRNAEFNPKRFMAVVIRIREPRSTALVFATGKMVVTGTKHEDDAKLASRKIARMIQKQDYSVRFQEFEIHNIIATANVGGPTEGIRLEALEASPHKPFITYDPESFPGLTYRMCVPRLAFLLFHKGRIVITGAKSRQDVYTAFDKMLPVLRQFPLAIDPVQSGKFEKLKGRPRKGGRKASKLDSLIADPEGEIQLPCAFTGDGIVNKMDLR